MLQLEDAFVAQGDAEDIGRQILERGRPFADRATVDYPILPPGLGGHLSEQSLLAQAVSHFAAEKSGQGFDVDEKVILGA